jgi:hypothetical protein
MTILPYNSLDRMIKLKEFDKEIYLFVANTSWLLGIATGLAIALIIILLNI